MKVFDMLPVLRKQYNPAVALILGFLTGGIGLGIYLRSLLDACIPVIVICLLSVKFHSGGVVFGAAIAATWGLLRVLSSNRRLAAAVTTKS